MGVFCDASFCMYLELVVGVYQVIEHLTHNRPYIRDTFHTKFKVQRFPLP